MEHSIVALHTKISSLVLGHAPLQRQHERELLPCATSCDIAKPCSALAGSFTCFDQSPANASAPAALG